MFRALRNFFRDLFAAMARGFEVDATVRQHEWPQVLRDADYRSPDVPAEVQPFIRRTL